MTEFDLNTPDSIKVAGIDIPDLDGLLSKRWVDTAKRLSRERSNQSDEPSVPKTRYYFHGGSYNEVSDEWNPAQVLRRHEPKRTEDDYALPYYEDEIVRKK